MGATGLGICHRTLHYAIYVAMSVIRITQRDLRANGLGVGTDIPCLLRGFVLQTARIP